MEYGNITLIIRRQMDKIVLPDYFYKLLYIIDLIDMERDWGEEKENGGEEYGYR